MRQQRRPACTGLALGAIGALVLWGILGTAAQGATTSTSFGMVRTAGLPSNCLPNAKATVKVVSNGPTETMTVDVSGLRAHTEFDFFVIQQPAAPFGMSWYQGDIETDAVAAHCPNVTTPFNGTHNAGPQVLNTHNFGNLDGPLNRIH